MENLPKPRTWTLLLYFVGGDVMKSRSKIMFSILLSLMLIICMVSISAFADGSVTYIDENGNPQECNDYQLISDLLQLQHE